VGIVAVGGAAIGLYMRLWLIFHAPTSSDVAVVGLMAQGALHGHFNAFYGGQAYGGTAEPILIALAFRIFGQSGVVAELVVGTLAAVAAVLTQRIALRLVPPKVALLAGVLAWAAPAVAVRDSVRVYGFRGVTLVCGLGLILAALRLLDDQKSLLIFLVLGLLAGIGWWSSPEIAYYLVPTAVLLGAALVRTRDWREWWAGLLVAVVGAIVGSLPWIWANAASGFASLHDTQATTVSFSGRLSIFFRYALPMEFGLRRADDGAWILGSLHLIALMVILAAIIAALGLSLARGGRAMAIGLGVLAFPILYAISPASWAWQDGRYASYLVPLLALTTAIGVCEAVRRWNRPPPWSDMVMSGMVALLVTLAVIGLWQVVSIESASYTSRWGDPDAPTVAAASKLERSGVATAYADYWVAYKLDFLSDGRLNITTVGYEDDRSPSINAAVERSKHPAWIFVPSREATIDGIQFTAPSLAVGPDTVTQAQFTTTLDRLGIGYRVVDVGILRAVIPDRTLSPHEAGMPGAGPST
jgi:hypothetical protein